MVFKVKKNKNYTIMSNYHLRDKRLSLKAKGLLSFMLSLPEDWNYNLDGLCKVCTGNRTSITNTLNELSLILLLTIILKLKKELKVKLMKK